MKIWILLASFASALRFEIEATAGQGTLRCMEQYAVQDQVITGRIDIPNRADQRITDDLTPANIHYSKQNVFGPQKFTFQVHQTANIRYCFTATLLNNAVPGPSMVRDVFLHLDPKEVKDTGVEGKYAAFENELRFLVGLTDEAYLELKNYDEDDEQMYTLNLSTMDRVFNFSSFTIVVLVGLGAYEVYYLYSFFKKKNII